MSLTCPHCAAFHAGAYNDIKREYVETGKVRFVIRDFPLDNLAVAAAMMARCLPRERYFGMIELLYRGQQGWARAADPRAALAGIGRLAGLSPAKFDACLKDRGILDVILKSRDQGQKLHQVQSTPTFIIDGRKLANNRPIEEFRKLIDAALAKKNKG